MKLAGRAADHIPAVRRRRKLEADLRRQRRRSWAWPVAAGAVGVIWYASESLRHRRFRGHGYDLHGELDVSGPQFLRAAEALTGAPITHGSTAELLINGDQIFPAMLETIEGAQHTLNLETYVWWRGDIADDIAHAVAGRAREGVECNVLLDALGSAKMDRKLLRVMTDAGANCALFRPPKPYALRRLTNRTHRRALVADGKVGMTGGAGIAAEWTGNAEDPDHWRDTHVRVRGPVVRGLQGAFAENWLEATGVMLASEHYLPELPAVEDGSPMHVLRSHAGVGDTNVEALYYLAIASARESLDLTAAYFAPRTAFVRAVVKAAERGVKIRVLTPGPHTDKQFVRVAGREVYDALLSAGVQIFEYQPTMLHAKTLVVDSAWSVVGTVNFDNRSFQLHDEVAICVQDRRFAGLLDEVFEADIERSTEMHPGRWSDRAPRQRVAEKATRLIRREL